MSSHLKLVIFLILLPRFVYCQTYTADQLGRLKTTAYSIMTMTYRYDANGNRVGSSVSGATLPVTLLDFAAQKFGSECLIKWTTSNTLGIKAFDVEFSIDGSTFHSINSVIAAGVVRTPGQYQVTHCCPTAGINYYRLKIIGNDDKFSYSPIRTVHFSSTEGMKVFPNPLYKGNEITISFLSPLKAVSSFYIYNTSGELIYSQNITKSTRLYKTSLLALSNGIYVIIVKSESILMSSKLIINR